MVTYEVQNPATRSSICLTVPTGTVRRMSAVFCSEPAQGFTRCGASCEDKEMRTGVNAGEYAADDSAASEISAAVLNAKSMMMQSNTHSA